ncbi:glycosyltransferase family 4 protein [Pontibacter ramchanderi]|uniref:Glycosyltransferase involved in cell wall biosynthesis n=1 Tax=Pontibacter ramchanderi TaxID=1179743 RepID=A0A2N3V1R4_9BACT|nr:glycosyltransferase family 4 protein [Pontibacter ramchanderi]PKV75526.1 glycosyltransferase involved in cell wall biosynthesis [Pontibacter ramchanderi]
MALKILLISHRFYPDIGGIETITEILAYSFFKEEYDVHVLTWSADSTGKAFPYKVIRKPNLLTLFQENAWADVVFENNPCMRLSWPNIIYNRPSFTVLQTWLTVDSKFSLSSRVKTWDLGRKKKVVAISDAVRRKCWKEAIVIGNTYDTSIFKNLPNIQRSEDFVFVGRLVSDKGAILAVKAVHALNVQSTRNGKTSKRFSLTIVGDGPERAYIEGIVANLRLQGLVNFTGALCGDELAKCLNQHKYLLVPSIWEEPFGIVALEGMACGCLPIVSDGGGLPDAVGNAGLTFSRGNVNAMVSCIQKLQDDAELEEQLRNAAKLHLEAHHPNKISQKLLNLIQEALE